MARDPSPHARRRLGAGLALLAVVLTGVALWLAVDNPAIDHTSRGDDYPCLAPWDTVLNGADNYPGGEPPPDGDDIERRCREAGEQRFGTAVGFLIGAGVVALASGLVGSAARRREGVGAAA